MLLLLRCLAIAQVRWGGIWLREAEVAVVVAAAVGVAAAVSWKRGLRGSELEAAAAG